LDLEDAERLAKEARRGDSDALVGLCRAFHPKILKYMQYRADAASAQDLTAEVLLKVVENIRSQNGSFRAWIFRIARNVVIDEARKRKIRREQPMDEQTVNTMQTQGDPAAAVARREALRAAVAQLSDDQRELVTLKFIEGLSNDEVAEITGRKHGAIRALQFRALAVMRNILGEGADYE
jgi:RNA polymerase sigma-70 factor (ECF subfamily)